MARYHVVDVGPNGIVDLDCICSNPDCPREHVHVFTDAELAVHDNTVAKYVLDRVDR